MVARLVNKGFKAHKRIFSPRYFRKALEKEIGVAMLGAAQILADEFKLAIDQGKIGPRNKELTIVIKGEDHPLLDQGVMRNAITLRLEKWNEAWAGIPDNTRAHRVAEIVSEGRSIEITDKMRLMFQLLWRVSTNQAPVSTLYGRAAELWRRYPGDWYPLGARKRVIRIPPRPFIEKTFRKKSVQNKLNKRIIQGLREAWREHVRIGGAAE